MSHEIVKGIKLKKDVKEVWVRAASNNVTPQTFYLEEMKGLSKMLKEEGEEALVKTFIRLYWEGAWQPGTANLYYRAAVMFDLHHPEINHRMVGPVVHQEILDAPLEVLPKYLNSEDRIAQEIVKARLNGEAYDKSAERYFTTLHIDDVKDMFYQEYLNYKKRKKGVFVIRTGYRGYVHKMGSRNMYYSASIAGAKTFTSREDAQVYIRQHHIVGLDMDRIRECEYENGFLKEK